MKLVAWTRSGTKAGRRCCGTPMGTTPDFSGKAVLRPSEAKHSHKYLPNRINCRAGLTLTDIQGQTRLVSCGIGCWAPPSRSLSALWSGARWIPWRAARVAISETFSGVMNPRPWENGS